MDFLSFIMKLNKEYQIITFEILSQLWDELGNSSLKQEKDLMFKWLKNFGDYNEQSAVQVAIFFKEKLIENESFA